MSYMDEDETRFAWYSVNGLGIRRCLCETSWQGLGPALRTMYEDGEIERGDAIGLLDQVTREWLINPWVRPPKATI